jgi:hypothetical protein
MLVRGVMVRVEVAVQVLGAGADMGVYSGSRLSMSWQPDTAVCWLGR